MFATVSARYDWFSASMDYEPDELLGEYSKRLKAEPRNVRPLNGYERAIGLFVGEEEAVRIQWSHDGSPNVLASGFPSQQVFEIAVDRFPNYRLARGDIAIDFDEADVFEIAHGAMRRLSHERKIKHHIRGDWETPGSPDGRTTYAGALGQSTVVRRLYEFSKCHGYGAPVRFELEIKPHSKAKHRYACMSPLLMIASDSYSVELLRRLGYSMDRVLISRDRVRPSASNWLIHLVRQYGPKLTEMIATDLEGDATRLGPKLTELYEAELARRREISRAAAADSDWKRLARGGQPLAT